METPNVVLLHCGPVNTTHDSMPNAGPLGINGEGKRLSWLFEGNGHRAPGGSLGDQLE
jgi:hypothetical protein